MKKLLVIVFTFLSLNLLFPDEIGSNLINEKKLIYKTKDGWEIHATFYPSLNRNRPLYISIHMLMSDRTYYPVRRSMLKKFNVLSIDMRGHGDSLMFRNKRTGWRTGRGNMFWGSLDDIRMGIKEVQRLYGEYVNTEKIFLQGSSYSCVLILNYFLKYPDKIGGLVFMSPGNSYGQIIVKTYRKMIRRKKKAPIIQICSSKDFYCYSKTRAMENIFKRYIKTKKMNKQNSKYFISKFIIEDEHVHGTHFFYTHPDKYPRIIIEWADSILYNAIMY